MNIFVHWINEDGGKGTLSLIHLLYCCRCRGGGGGGGGDGYHKYVNPFTN